VCCLTDGLMGLRPILTTGRRGKRSKNKGTSGGRRITGRKVSIT